MKYCITKNQCVGTEYFEFQKGRFKSSFWAEDSLYIADNIFAAHLLNIFMKVCPNFDFYGIPNIISKAQWSLIVSEAERDNKVVREIVGEINLWVRTTLTDETCFSVLGI